MEKLNGMRRDKDCLILYCIHQMTGQTELLFFCVDVQCKRHMIVSICTGFSMCEAED